MPCASTVARCLPTRRPRPKCARCSSSTNITKSASGSRRTSPARWIPIETTRVTGRGPKSPVDEEFLKQLYQGGELLAQGLLTEARTLLERAHQLQPRNEKGRNLLGLAYFKLGHFHRPAQRSEER